MLRDKVRRQLRGKASSQRTIQPEHLWSVTRIRAHHGAQYEIFTSSAPDTGFIFVEAEPLRRPASVKISTQQNTGRPVGRGSG